MRVRGGKLASVDIAATNPAMKQQTHDRSLEREVIATGTPSTTGPGLSHSTRRLGFPKKVGILMTSTIQIGVPVGTFRRGSVIHLNSSSEGRWAIVLERDSDKATLLQHVEFYGPDGFEGRPREVISGLVEAKLTNAFGYVEYMLACPSPRSEWSADNIAKSCGMFEYATRAQPVALPGNKFSFLEPIVKEQFAHFAEAYGFEVV